MLVPRFAISDSNQIRDEILSLNPAEKVCESKRNRLFLYAGEGEY